VVITTRSPQRFATTAWSKSLIHLRAWLSEPLLQFLLAGGLIFASYQYLTPEAGRTDQSLQIFITKDDIRQIALAWLAQGRGRPTPDQMKALIDQKVGEEVLFREAMAMGLDKGDEIIKRRLAQKMDFLAADVAALQSPSEPELRAWFTKNADRFAQPSRVSFRHVYFSLDRGPGARDVAATALTLLAGKPGNFDPPAGFSDPFMFRDYYSERTSEQVAKEFGPEFARALFQVKSGAWQGPIPSGYGWHLVFIEAIEPTHTPAFEEVAPDVKSAWLDERQRQIKQAAFEVMRGRYQVFIAPLQAKDFDSLPSPQGPPPSADMVPQ
jgi:hypothetical protein